MGVGDADKEWRPRHHRPGPKQQTRKAPGCYNSQGGAETAAGVSGGEPTRAATGDVGSRH